MYLVITTQGQSNSAPTITGISPTGLTVGVPSFVSVSGTNFTSNSVVAADFCSCGPTKYISSTLLKCEITPDRMGTHSIRVINTDGSASSNVIGVSGKALLDETFSTDRAAPLGNSVTQYSADVAGAWRSRFSTASTVASGALQFSSTDSAARFTDVQQRFRKGGRLHRVDMTTRTGAGHDSRQLGLGNDIPSDVSNWETGAAEYGFQSKTGSGNAEDGRFLRDGTTSGTFFRKDFWTESTNFQLALLEREGSGGIMLNKANDVWKILHMAYWGSKPCRLLISNGTAAHGKYSRIATYETGWTMTPLVADSFERADSSTIGASDGNGQPEKGGANVTPTIGGSGTAGISSNRLVSTTDGSVVCLWDCGESGHFTNVMATPVDGSPVGLIVRAQDSGNYWLAQINSSTENLEIIEVNSGVQTVRVTSSISGDPTPGTINSGSEYGMQFTADGNELRAWIDDVAATHNAFATYTSSSMNTATKVGVMVNKGASVASSKARNFAVFNTTQNLPEV